MEGLGGSDCASRVQTSLRALDGVLSAEVDWESGWACVDYIPEKTNKDALALAVATAGKDVQHHYRAQVVPFPGGRKGR